MRFAVAACALACGLGGLVAPGHALDGKSGSPFELVRSLQDLQEQAARGNASAPKAQATLMAHISQRLAAAGPETWRDRRNVRALITYLLSGGSAQAVKTFPEPGSLGRADESLIKGAYAYAFGRGTEAAQFLSEVDPRVLPSSLGGHVAFVRATLGGKDDPQGAIAMLDLARLLAPGTLVEEAALRREVFVIGSTGDFDKLIQLSRQYFSRFERSVYADNFLEGFAGSLLQIEITDDPVRFGRLDAVMASLGPDVRCELYLQIARAAILKGRTGTARMAADKAEGLASSGSLEMARAKLYLAASTVTSADGYDRAVERLEAIAQASLARDDAELREAVTGIARRLRQWPQPANGKGPEAPNAPSGKLAKSAATIDLAQRSLLGADDLLKAQKP